MDKSTLLMPFLDESQHFTNGFECGMIWQMISEGEVLEKRPVHNCNVEQIKMICESFGVGYEIAPFCDEWSSLTVGSILK